MKNCEMKLNDILTSQATPGGFELCVGGLVVLVRWPD